MNIQGPIFACIALALTIASSSLAAQSFDPSGDATADTDCQEAIEQRAEIEAELDEFEQLACGGVEDRGGTLDPGVQSCIFGCTLTHRGCLMKIKANLGSFKLPVGWVFSGVRKKCNRERRECDVGCWNLFITRLKKD